MKIVPFHRHERTAEARAVRHVVDRFYARVLADPDLVGYFDGVDLAQLKRHQALVAVVEQSSAGRFLPLARAAGGPTPFLIGDARLHDTLILANVAAARCIMAEKASQPKPPPAVWSMRRREIGEVLMGRKGIR